MKFLPFLSLATLFMVSCSSNTPQSRIQKNPKIYRSLKTAEQALVEVGKIQNGMSPAAVFLAWGPPDAKSEGESKGKRYEQWVYQSLSPVVVQNAWGGWGGGWGRGWGRGPFIGPGWGPWGWNGGFGTDIAYIPRTSSWVKFVNNRADSWQLGANPR